MKISITCLLIALALTGLSLRASAQSSSGDSSRNKPFFSVGAEGGFSAGSFKHTNGWEIGGSLQADIPVAQQLFFIANAGYLNFYGRNSVQGTGVSSPGIHFLPVKAGLKLFVLRDIYVQADAGAGFLLNKTEVGSQRTAAFLYSPQAGVKLPLSGNSFIDAAALYEASTKYTSGVNNTKVNFFGLRLAYGLSTK
jgi:hypothetical protein